MTLKCCLFWTAEWSGEESISPYATRRQKYQSSRARSDGQRYPDKILSQVAIVGCHAKLTELSWLQRQLGPWQRDGSARIKCIIKQGAADCFQNSHQFLEFVSSPMAKRCWFCCYWDMGVQVGKEFTACFHLRWGYIAHMPLHTLKSRFSVEFPRMQEAKEIKHVISLSLL